MFKIKVPASIRAAADRAVAARPRRGRGVPVGSRLYRVWMHTLGDESIHELIVTAANAAEAEARARDHVKASNLGKGNRATATSRALSRVLSVKATTKPYCLEIHQIPVAAARAIASSEDQSSTVD